MADATMQPIITKRERRVIKRVVADFPYLAPLFERVEALAEEASAIKATSHARVEAAERRERDMGREAERLRCRIAELESKI